MNQEEIDEIKQDAYLDGSRRVWQQLVSLSLSHLDGQEKTRTELIAEREEALDALKHLCEEFDLPIEWERDLHLADIIEKHIYRSLREQITD